MDVVALFILLLILLSLQAIPQGLYFYWMKKVASRPWNLKVNPNFRPKVTVIVPTYQEVDVIEYKLLNLNSIEYPEDKMEVIIVDGASTDGTFETCKNWLLNNNFRFKILLLSEPKRVSKAYALNYALGHANGEIIVTSDADAFLTPDILIKSVPYFADPDVCALSGREVIKNADKCFLAKMENLYRDIYYMMRSGESKMFSTQIFQGEFAAYKREALCSFVDEPGRADDNGTVTEIIKKGKRCIFIPEALFYDAIPCSLKDYLEIKIRRAAQLQREFFLRLKLRIKGELKISISVLVANLHQHCISPLLFVLSIPLAIYFMICVFMLAPLLTLIIISAISILIYDVRYVAALYIISNSILLMALFRNIFRRRTLAWKAIRSSRKSPKLIPPPQGR